MDIEKPPQKFTISLVVVDKVNQFFNMVESIFGIYT